MNSSTSMNSELPQQKFLQITDQHDKFYSRLLSKESSISNPSFRVYYGGASGAVPFVWESHPGTPKRRTATANPLPPLTPPPSYQFNHPNNNNNNKNKASSKSNLIQCILPRTKKTPTISTSTSTSTTQFASSSVSLSSTTSTSSSGSSSSSRAEDEDSVDGGSPTSTLRGCYSMLAMKNVLLSIVGGGGGSRRSS